MEAIPPHCLQLLYKLKKIANTQCNSSLDLMIQSWLCFEVCCALQKAYETNKRVFVWPDLNPDIKDKLGLPQQDVGIDYIDEDCIFAGQAKLYKEGSYIKASDIERHRLCVYRGIINNREDPNIFKERCEVATSEKVKLGNCRIPMNDIIHKIITKKMMRYWYKMALSLDNSMDEEDVEKTNNDAQDTIKEPELRKCQEEALACIQKGRINRIRLACGSGKTRIAKEVIMRENGQYLVLVPYITLLEQWGDYFKECGIDVIMIGTGYVSNIGKLERNKITAIICVYDSYEKAFYYKDDEGVEYQRNFKYIIVDEAHHIADKEEGRNGEIWKLVEESKSSVLLSASLDKGEENDNSLVHYNYSLRDAIADSICCDYDIRLAFFNIEPTMKMIAGYISKNLQYLSVLAYCNSIDSARRLAKWCKKFGVTAECISCEESKKERREILDRFERGDIRVLVSVNTLGEGVNILSADTCLFAEPRSSEISITQCVGRIVRKSKGKEMAHVIVCTSIDREENIGKHPIVKILRALSVDDVKFVSKAVNKSGSSRIYCDVVEGEEEDGELRMVRGQWIRDEIMDSGMKYVRRGDWMVNFTLLKKFYKNNGRLPKITEECGGWLNKQRNATKNKDNRKLLTTKQLELMNSTFKHWLITKYSEETWYQNFQKLKTFYEENERLPKIHEENGTWLTTQRQTAKNKGSCKSLTKKQLELMNETFKDWLVNFTEEMWYQNFQKLKIFYEKNKRLPKVKEENGTWLDRQRVAARNKGNKKPLTKNQYELMNNTFNNWLLISTVT